MLLEIYVVKRAPESFSTRVARWYIFKPKNPNFVEILEGLRWKNVATFYGHLGYFMTI
jgi:hypothetical protein